MDGRGVLAASADKDFVLLKDERWNLVRRIASSPHFAKATQPRDILLYITQRYLTEGVTSISELDIARNVLQRRSDFDPTDDSIVRVQISHIRKKLEAYYAAEGREEEILITIPRGGYVPKYEPVIRANASRSVTAEVVNPPAIPEQRPVFSGWAFGVAGLLFGALLVFAGFRIFGREEVKNAGGPPAVYAQNPLLNRIFGSSIPVTAVTADSSLSMVQDALKVDIDIHNYSNSDYVSSLIKGVRDQELRQTLQAVYDRQYTSLGSATVAFRCQEVGQQFRNAVSIRYARNMHVRDFEKGNFILIGSHRSVPWVALFESQLNFSFEENLDTQSFYFRNRKPEPGEKDLYTQILGKESYADIALVPNLGKNGYVLLLRGLAMESPEAAVDFLFNADVPHNLLELENSGKPFEVLLRNHISEGASSGFDIVAIRRL